MNRFWSPRRLVRGAGEDSETAAATGSGRHLRAFLIVLLVLSFAPVPTTGDALATDRPASRPRPVPPANAVRLLERQHAAGTTERRPAATATRPKAQRNAKQRRAQRHEARGNPKPRARKRAERIHVKGCLFKVRKRTWTLARNCAPRGTIVVPNGFTLTSRSTGRTGRWS